MSDIETVCDELADWIDDCSGTCTDEEIRQFLSKCGQPADELTMKFQELYLCTPYGYAQNSREDTAWLANP